MIIQAFFWDYDNTIIATAEAHWNKHVAVLKHYGIRLDEVYKQRIYENNGNQNWEWLTRELKLKASKEEYLNAIDNEFQKAASQLELRPGVLEVMELLKKLKIPQAIVTNARQKSAEPIIKLKNIDSYMKFIIFKEDYEGRKPQPGPYLAGIKKMSEILNTAVVPKHCIAIEDDPLGVESAFKAGTIVIHRKIFDGAPETPFATYSCYHPTDLLDLIKTLTIS